MSELSAAEIEPAELERELSSGAPIAVVDMRDPDAVAEWPLDAGPGVVRAVSEADLTADPGAALADLPEDTRVRLICNAGVRSRRLQPLVASRFPHTAGVNGGMIGWARVLTAGEVPMPGPVEVWQFRRQARGCLSYLVQSGGSAVVVDPAPAVAAYERAAAALGSEIVAVFDSHVHADHLSGARELAARTGAPLRMSGRALERGIADAERFEPVSSGEQIGIRGLRALALPGHTSDMTGLVVEGAALIAGDSLFADSVARPDLEAGDEGAEEAAAQLLATLQVHVLTLPPSTLVLPCHYPGGRLPGPLAPTLAAVRAAVPELELPATEFARRVLRSMPPRPANYERIIEVNLGRGGADPEEHARLELGANNCAVGRR